MADIEQLARLLTALAPLRDGWRPDSPVNRLYRQLELELAAECQKQLDERKGPDDA